MMYDMFYEHTPLFVHKWGHTIYIYVHIPVVPHKAVAEVSKIGNL